MQDDDGERGDRRPGTGAQLEIEKVTAIQESVKIQIPMLPGLALNREVKSVGRVPSPDENNKILQQIGINWMSEERSVPIVRSNARRKTRASFVEWNNDVSS